MNRTTKTIIFVCLMGIFVLWSSIVFALEAEKPKLELNYPKLPGLEPLESGKALGWYIKYFLHLFFYIAAGACVVAIIIGGFLYASGMQRTTSIIKAREWIKRGLTGLFILLFSWLFLYVVNPQLLILKITKEGDRTSIYHKLAMGKGPNVGFVRNPTGSFAAAVLNEFEEPAFTAWGAVANNQSDSQFKIAKSLPLAGQILSALTADSLLGPNPVSYPKYQMPFYEAKYLSEQLVVRAEQYKELIACCRCGLSKFHYGYEQGLDQAELKCRCLPGTMDKERCIKEIKELEEEFGNKTETDSQGKIVKTNDLEYVKDKAIQEGKDPDEAVREKTKEREEYVAQKMQAKYKSEYQDKGISLSTIPINSGDCWGCVNQCEECACDLDCVHKVEQKWGFNVPVATSEGQQLEFQEAYINFLKQKREEIAEVVGHLENLQDEITTLELDLTAKSLELHKILYLAKTTKGFMFTNDFGVFSRDFLEQENLGFWQNWFLFGQEDKTNISLVDVPSVFSFGIGLQTTQLPGVNKAVIEKQESQDMEKFTVADYFYPANIPDKALGSVFSQRAQEVAEINKEETAEACSRIGLFPVLALTVYEEFQRMMEDCLAAAFGEVGLKDLLGNQDIQAALEEMIKLAISEAVGSGITFDLSGEAKTAAEYITADLANKIKTDVEDKCIAKCEKECPGWSPQTRKQKECGADDCPTCCHRECKHIAVNFISRTLSKFLTEPLEKRLPDSIEAILNQTVEEAFVDPQFRTKFLNEEIIDLLKRGAGDIAQTSLQEQIPGLMDILAKETGSLLPFGLGDAIGAIDDIYFKKALAYQKRIKQEGAQWVADWVGEKLKPLFEKIPGSKHKLYAEKKLKANSIIKIEEDILDVALGQDRPITSYDDFVEHCAENLTSDPQNPPMGMVGGTYKELSKREVEKLCAGEIFAIYQDEIESERFRQVTKASVSWQVWGSMLKSWGAGLKDILWDEFLALPSQMAEASVRVAAYTLTQYTISFVEDKFLTPYIYPYFQETMNLVNRVDNLLENPIKNILPQFLEDVLEKSITDNFNHILKTVCQAGQRAEAQNKQQAIVSADAYTWLGADVAIDKEIALSACNIYQSLNETVKQKLSDEGQEFLSSDIKTILTSEDYLGMGWLGFLNRAPAAILEQALDLESGTLVKIINASPKNLICGEIPPVWQQHCQPVLRIKDWGWFKERKFEFVTQEEKDKYEDICLIIDGLCQQTLLNALPVLAGPVEVLSNMAVKECDYLVSNECQDGYHCSQCSSQEKGFWCQSCDTVINKTLGFSILNFLLGKINDQEQEAAFLAWIWVGLGANTDPQLQNIIQAVASERALGEDWAKARAEIKNVENLDNFPDSLKQVAYYYIMAFWENKKLRDVITEAPLGVVKPFQAGERTILKERNRGEARNFLAKTPAQFLETVCHKIKYEWTTFIDPEKFPKKEDRPTPYDALNDAEILAYEAAYYACSQLQLKPAEALGMDKILLDYLGNYRYMFEILWDPQEILIERKEKPEALNGLLDFVNQRTLVDVLFEAGVAIEEEGISNMSVGCILWREEYGGDGQIHSVLMMRKSIEEMKGDCLEQQREDGHICADSAEDSPQVRCLNAVETQRNGRAMQDVADFLSQTTIIKELQSHWPKTLLDYTCEWALKTDCVDKPEPQKTICQEQAEGTCQEFLGKSLAEILEIEEARKWFKEVFLEKYFKRTPLIIIKEEIQKLLGDWPPEKIRKALNETIMGWFNKQPHTNWLGRPLIDTLGRWVGADIWLNDALEWTEDNISQHIDNAVEGAQEGIQRGVNKLFVQTPQNFMNFVAKGLNSEMAQRFTTRLFEDTTGGCQVMVPGNRYTKLFSIDDIGLLQIILGYLEDKSEVCQELSQAFQGVGLSVAKGAPVALKETDDLTNIDKAWKLNTGKGFYELWLTFDGRIEAYRNNCAPPYFYTQEKGGQCCHLGKGLVCQEREQRTCKKCRFLNADYQTNPCYDFETHEYDDFIDGKFINSRCCKILEEDVIKNQCCQTVIDCFIEKINLFLEKEFVNTLTDKGPALDRIDKFEVVGF